MSSVIDSIERSQLKQGLPNFDPGDRVRVHFQVIEGNRRRTQVFEGVVIRRQGSGARETFTVRKQSFGFGVERTFPLHSPKIEKLEVAARGAVRRAKLYYLRGRIGKAARVAERRWGIDEDLISSPPPEPEPEAESSEAELPADEAAAEVDAEAGTADEAPEAEEEKPQDEAVEAEPEAEAEQPQDEASAAEEEKPQDEASSEEAPEAEASAEAEAEAAEDGDAEGQDAEPEAAKDSEGSA